MTTHTTFAETFEWAPFTLRPGVTEAALLAASAELERDFLAGQPGYLRRDLLRGPDGTYADAVWWTSPETASAAMERAERSPVCARYFGLMAENGEGAAAGVQHFRRLDAA